MQRKHFRAGYGFVHWIPVILILVFVVGVAANMQAIRDYGRLYNYVPPVSIKSFADQTTMTDSARTMFYVNHPVLADRTTFGGQCTSRGEQTIVLGCYKPVDRGIFLFDVQDTRLNGVEQVTAAHEMLHAAYDRLSRSERERIDVQLQNFYNEQIKDKNQRLRSTITAYEKSEPNDIQNEMHSIFATEVADLPTELEVYYKRYFSDRSKVIAYAEGYRHEFTTRQEKVRVYDLQLLSLKDRIDRNRLELERRENDITRYQQQMEDFRGRDEIESYNAVVPVYNGRVDEYNTLVRSVQACIKEYNRLVAERNQLASQIRELTESISSELEPIQQ